MTLKQFIQTIKPLLSLDLSEEMLNKQIEFVYSDLDCSFSCNGGAEWDSEKEGNIVIYLSEYYDTKRSINE
jgi:hypothetical protein